MTSQRSRDIKHTKDHPNTPFSLQMCDPASDLCYFENTAIKNYLNLPETRELLGIESPKNFTPCSDTVGDNFSRHMDKWGFPTQYYVSSLLDRGVRVLIYLGTYDWQCNASANKLWVEKLEWYGQDSYLAQPWREWIVDGGIAGETKKSGLLTVATVSGAGHMMSTDFFSSTGRC